MNAGINQSHHSHVSNTSKLLDKSNDTGLGEPAQESPDDMNQSSQSLMNVPPEEDARD